MLKRYLKKISCGMLSFFLLISLGCASTNKEKNWSEQKWYQDGLSKISQKRYEGSRESFKKVQEGNPEAKLNALAQIGVADSYFREDKYEEAKLEYQKFLQLYPLNEKADYAKYNIGMCYFEQLNSAACDQSPTKNAIAEFEDLSRKYTKSPFVESALQNIEICKSRLAQQEFYVGYFYYKEKSYNAAIERFQTILTEYSTVGINDQVLFYIGKTYYKLEEKGKAEEFFNKLINQFPQSKFVKDAQDLIS